MVGTWFLAFASLVRVSRHLSDAVHAMIHRALGSASLCIIVDRPSSDFPGQFSLAAPSGCAAAYIVHLQSLAHRLRCKIPHSHSIRSPTNSSRHSGVVSRDFQLTPSWWGLLWTGLGSRECIQLLTVSPLAGLSGPGRWLFFRQAPL